MCALALHCDKKSKNAFICVLSAFLSFNDKIINWIYKIEIWCPSARFTGICARVALFCARCLVCKKTDQKTYEHIFIYSYLPNQKTDQKKYEHMNMYSYVFLVWKNPLKYCYFFNKWMHKKTRHNGRAFFQYSIVSVSLYEGWCCRLPFLSCC